MKRIVLLSDTHNFFDKRFEPYLKDCDEIWHAGDIGLISIIEKLESFAPVKAVYGNIDDFKLRSEFEEILFFNCENVRVIMTHIGGSSLSYTKKIRDIIKRNKPNLFICGHSHILKVEYKKKFNLLHLNPGASGNYGPHKVKTILCFNIADTEIVDLKVVEVPR
ncbi:MAG: metallophosphoesterase family protein [Bacteroidota bacterium]|nr:metallophosphoesterase family protein [Bacteroidota bacterium]